MSLSRSHSGYTHPFRITTVGRCLHWTVSYSEKMASFSLETIHKEKYFGVRQTQVSQPCTVHQTKNTFESHNSHCIDVASRATTETPTQTYPANRRVLPVKCHVSKARSVPRARTNSSSQTYSQPNKRQPTQNNNRNFPLVRTSLLWWNRGSRGNSASRSRSRFDSRSSGSRSGADNKLLDVTSIDDSLLSTAIAGLAPRNDLTGTVRVTWRRKDVVDAVAVAVLAVAALVAVWCGGAEVGHVAVEGAGCAKG